MTDPHKSLFAQAMEHQPTPYQVRRQQDQELIRDVIRITEEYLRNSGRAPSVGEVMTQIGLR